MSEQTPLIVPMTVEAFVVNSYTGLPEYVSNGMNYFGMINELTSAQQGLMSPQSPENPAPFYGVYLKWRLPAAFTNGVQDSAGGRTVFPPVPNRWLVVRYGGADAANRTATAWIVSSDQLNTQQGLRPRAQDGANYLGQPAPHEANQQIQIGVPVQLPVSGGWSDPGPSRHLTAVAPGNHAFAYFQPSCNSVFSFVDTLDFDAPGVPDQTFSYIVAGWFSESDDDPLSKVTSETSFTDVINALGWQVSDNDASTYATATVVSGFIDGVQWTEDKPIPAAKPTEASGIGIAMGNTSTEALTALIQAVSPNLDTQLLEALQLDMVENLDQTDGEAMLDQAIQGSFFKRYSGGYTWTIVADRQGKHPKHSKPPSHHELQKEAAILAALNAQQRDLDQKLLRLDTLRDELYLMWWKFVNMQSSPPPSGSIITLQEVQQQLDPTHKGSIAAQIVQLMNEVKNSPVPSGNTPKALQAAINAYAAIHGLPVNRRLKRSSAPSFYEVNNPVILISGAGSTNIARTPKQVACRFPDELISAFQYDNNTFDDSSIPQPSFGNISGPPAWWTSVMQSLNVEFFLLDPNNATIIANALGQPSEAAAIAQQISGQAVANYPDGTIPAAVAQQQWTENPWHPLLLRWAVDYTPIPYGSYGENWTFQDGQYAWNGKPIGGASTSLGPNGIIVLTPTAAFNMQARVQAFINNNPTIDPDAFQALLDDGLWDLLSQSLDGFNEQLLLGQPGAFLSPASTTFHTEPTLTELLAGARGYPPQLGPVPTSPPAGPTGFQLWRSGQLVLSELTVIDEWGQSLDLIDPTSKVTVFGPPEFQPLMSSNDALLDIESGTAIVSPKTQSPMTIQSVSLDGFNLTVNGTGFTADATINWFGAQLVTTFVSATQLTAIVSTVGITGRVPIAVTAAIPVAEKPSNPFVLPPALLQPGQLDFSLVSAIDDSKPVGPGSNANPICGWVIPNILDNGLLAFDPSGTLLGELGIDISTSDQPAVTWNNNPFSRYTGGLPEIAKKIPHFGRFLLKLSEQSAAELETFLQIIDDTLWTTLPSSASFDQNLAVFIGRPLAMVRAGLQFLLDGAPTNDPSWQFTFKHQQQVEALEFGIQLGDVTQLEDGLIGYFMFDDYETFNVVQESGATSDGYLKLIGLGNYIRKRFDGKGPTYVSMLVDPRASVNATTGILPAVTVSMPQELVSAALSNMNVTFRVEGALTDQQPAATGKPTILLPTRREPGAVWKWLENDEQQWQKYAIAPNDTNARLSPVPPVLRSGLLQLSIEGELS